MAMNENTLAEELRAMREEMRAMREQMSEMIGDTNKKLEVIGSFVAAINESQTFEKTMHAVENVTKDVTGCDKADFIAEDNGEIHDHPSWNNYVSEANINGYGDLGPVQIRFN